MEVIGRLATAVIHDLNNLLTVVQLNASLIETGGLSADEAIAAAGKIEEAAHRSAELTRKVLNFARRRPDETEVLRLDHLVIGLTRLLEPLIARRVQISILCPDGEVWVKGNQGGIEQAVMNLVLNAVDAMPGGGEVVITCRAASHAAPGRFAQVVVADHGQGIPIEVRKTIFDPFFTTKEQGTGMGLAIVRQVARMHGGDVEFDSEPGRGTEFRLLLPVAEPVTAPPHPVEIRRTDALKRADVLLVEDDAGIRGLTRRLLENAGMRVAEAESAEEALGIWSQRGGAFDLLFTDIILPGALTGRDLARQLLEEKPGLAVLYMSGYSGPEQERAFLNDANFLSKPFPPSALTAALRTVLGAAS